jgi:hypothetical protein
MSWGTFNLLDPVGPLSHLMRYNALVDLLSQNSLDLMPRPFIVVVQIKDKTCCGAGLV